MEKTLETLTLVHRLILGVAIALFIAGISIHRPDETYKDAEDEVRALQEPIWEISDGVDKGNKVIYQKSELKSSIVEWLIRRKVPQRDIDIEVAPSADLRLPNDDSDALVTVGDQVKWADRVYHDLDSPFFLCRAEPPAILHALDKVFSPTTKPPQISVKVYLHGVFTDPSARFSCQVEVHYKLLGALPRWPHSRNWATTRQGDWDLSC